MKKWKFKDNILLIIASLILLLSIYLKVNIYNSSFDQYMYSVLKISGAGGQPVKFISYIIAFFVFVIIYGIFLLPTIDFDKKLYIRNSKKKEKQILPIKNTKRYNRIVLAISIICLGISVGFFDFAFNGLVNSDLFKDYYVSGNDVKIDFPNKKRNLIYIFMESTETSNVSKANGGTFDVSIMPNLENMALNNLNFSNSNLLGGAEESYGTSWTVAAMIAQTSGVPLKLKVDDYDSNSTKFSNIVTLGDILKDNGYNNYLMIGSDSEFGGRKAYFSTHGYEISDYYTAIKEGKISSDYYKWWGYEDKKLFTYAKEKLMEISKDDESFNLTLLTADTHFADGYLEDDCEEVFDNHYANSFYCSDKMVSDFISWVKEQDFYDNTTIIITGDHPTMQNNFYKLDNGYKRTVFNTFINVYNDNNVRNKNRIFTTMDMFPTTLGAMGVNIEGNRLGIGTNLFSDSKTLAEEMGIDKLNTELKKNSAYYYQYIRKNEDKEKK